MNIFLFCDEQLLQNKVHELPHSLIKNIEEQNGIIIAIKVRNNNMKSFLYLYEILNVLNIETTKLGIINDLDIDNINDNGLVIIFKT